MNGRQFGTPVGPERSSANGSLSQRVEQPRPAEPTREVAVQQQREQGRFEKDARRNSRAPRERSRRFPTLAVIIGVIVLLGLGAWYIFARPNGSSALIGIDKSGYQAVFLTNGQTYFGKLQSSSSEYLKLTDIYYLDSQAASGDTQGKDTTNTSTATDTTKQNNLQLFKVSDATVIGPKDEMYISKKQVLFYENLKPDSKVVQSIAKYKQANN